MFLNAGNVTPNGFSFEENLFISQEKDNVLRKGKLQRGDIVYTTRGTVGNAALYSTTVPFENIRINSGMVILRCHKDIVDRRYLYQILKSEYFRPYFKKYCTGSAQPQLPIMNFSKIELDLPSIETQRRIADILSAYDDLIENNRKQIKMLEEELQVPLLIRGTKKITLTEAGKTLYEQAGTLLMFADLTRREVVKSSQSATLHIGMTPSTVSLLADYLLRFSRKYPHIHFDVHEGSTFALKDQLENHMVDLTTLRTPIVLNGCETKTLLKESITAMALPSHPLFAGRETLSLTELAEQPLILSNRYRKYMLSAFEQAGLFCDIYLTCEDARTAMTMAEKGLGIALLPASMLNLTHKLKACTITDADLTTEILLAWRKGRLPSELRAFLELWDENDSLNNQIHVPQP